MNGLQYQSDSVRPIPLRDLDHILEKTAPFWSQLRNKRLFVTGGTGFFGRWLLESFVLANETFDLNANALVLTCDRAGPPMNGVEFLQGDLRDFEFPVGDFSHAIHAATIEHGDLIQANTAGTKRLLELAVNAKVEKLLFTSSGAVYGDQPSEVKYLTEDYPGQPSPSDAYGQSKRMSESLCLESATANGFDTIIARCFAFVGPALPLSANFAVGNFVRDALGGGPVVVNSDGSSVRSYLYAGDLTAWIWTLLFRGQSNGIYNVGSDQAITIGDVAGTVAAVVSPNVEVEIGNQPSGFRKRYVPSIEKVRREFGLTPGIDLPEGVRRMAEWYAGAPQNIPRTIRKRRRERTKVLQ